VRRINWSYPIKLNLQIVDTKISLYVSTPKLFSISCEQFCRCFIKKYIIETIFHNLLKMKQSETYKGNFCIDMVIYNILCKLAEILTIIAYQFLRCIDALIAHVFLHYCIFISKALYIFFKAFTYKIHIIYFHLAAFESFSKNHSKTQKNLIILHF